jgi:hypothetical protein
MMSIFALGHSSTLFAATVAGCRTDTGLGVAIAASVVFVGVVAMTGRRRDWSWFAAAVFAVGLVHGLGLPTRLQTLGLPPDGLISRVLAFNVGVELGQLLAVTVIYLDATAVVRYLPRPLPAHLAPSVLIAAGLVAAVLVPITATDELPFAQGRSNVCTLYDHPAAYPAGTVRPSAFRAPGVTVDPAALGRVLAGGFAWFATGLRCPAARSTGWVRG